MAISGLGCVLGTATTAQQHDARAKTDVTMRICMGFAVGIGQRDPNYAFVRVLGVQPTSLYCISYYVPCTITAVITS